MAGGTPQDRPTGDVTINQSIDALLLFYHPSAGLFPKLGAVWVPKRDDGKNVFKSWKFAEGKGKGRWWRRNYSCLFLFYPTILKLNNDYFWINNFSLLFSWILTRVQVALAGHRRWFSSRWAPHRRVSRGRPRSHPSPICTKLLFRSISKLPIDSEQFIDLSKGFSNR